MISVAGDPLLIDPAAYALEISGDSLEPIYRDGDLVIVSPTAPIRHGDRVVIRTNKGELIARRFSRRTDRRVEFSSLNPAHPDCSFDPIELAWMHRIIWASQ